MTHQGGKSGFAIHKLQNVKLQTEITNLLENCESWWNSFPHQIILLALHTPSTPNPNNDIVGFNASVTIGIPFNKQHYTSIWGLILCIICLSIIIY